MMILKHTNTNDNTHHDNNNTNNHTRGLATLGWRDNNMVLAVGREAARKIQDFIPQELNNKNTTSNNNTSTFSYTTYTHTTITHTTKQHIHE